MMLTTGTQHTSPHIRPGTTDLIMGMLDIRLVDEHSSSIELFRVVHNITLNGQVASCPQTCVNTESLGWVGQIRTYGSGTAWYSCVLAFVQDWN